MKVRLDPIPSYTQARFRCFLDKHLLDNLFCKLDEVASDQGRNALSTHCVTGLPKAGFS